jgi:hypothetical protein
MHLSIVIRQGKWAAATLPRLAHTLLGIDAAWRNA